MRVRWVAWAEGTGTPQAGVCEGPKRVGTVSSHGTEAVVAVALGISWIPGAAVLPIAAAQSSAGSRTERLLDGGKREFARWSPAAAPAA